jgi:hypothetical protein
MLFTWESTELALKGGYLNPARNNPDPSLHFAWAATQPCEIMRDDLMEKYDLQFDHLSAQTTGAALAANFYAETSVRLNSWGADFGSQTENSLDGSVQETWARAATLADLKRETEQRVRILFESSYL